MISCYDLKTLAFMLLNLPDILFSDGTGWLSYNYTFNMAIHSKSKWLHGSVVEVGI